MHSREPRKCKFCGKVLPVLPGRGRPMERCQTCRPAKNQQPGKPKLITCVECGHLKMSRYGAVCQTCYLRLRYHRLKAEQGDGRTPVVWKRAVDRRRARLTEAFVEDVDLSVVASRDDWRCHLCTCPVDPAAVGEWAPTLDHVVPLSRGGMHSYDNVMLAHLWCNMSKGSRVA